MSKILSKILYINSFLLCNGYFPLNLYILEGLTPEYVAPEEFPDSKVEVDIQTDIYQLGVVAFELFTGRLPYKDSNLAKAKVEVLLYKPEKLKTDLLHGLDEIFDKALAAKKENRYEYINYFIDDLKELRS